MKKEMECPFCDGQAKLEVQEKDFLFKKENFVSHEYFYKCNKCAEEFTTSEVDEFTILQINNQYRSKHCIPFPEQIRDLKERYGLSSAKMSDVLGLGANGYGNYEKGEIPTQAIGNLISSAENPTVFKNMLERIKDSFSATIYAGTLKRVESLINKEEDFAYIRPNLYNQPNPFTGFRAIDKKKISNLILAFISRCKEDFNDKLKLNKLLFYTDFLNYKTTGYSMTGLTYRAIQYGPVPSYYENLYIILENDGIITSSWKKESDRSGNEVFVTERDFDFSVFDTKEIETIDMIVAKFKDTPSWDMVDLSHEEKSWKDLNASKEVIDYQKYAFCLEGI